MGASDRNGAIAQVYGCSLFVKMTAVASPLTHLLAMGRSFLLPSKSTLQSARRHSRCLV